MSDKTIPERFPRWFMFGEYPESELVDVSDLRHDIFQKVPLLTAERLVAARDEFVDEILNISLELRSSSGDT